MVDRIDVEALLTWAYRTQCVDKAVAAAAPRGPAHWPANQLAQVMQLGTRVDGGALASSLGAVSAPADAVLVHDAVLRLQAVFLDWVDGGGILLHSAASLAEIGGRVEDAANSCRMILASGLRYDVTRVEPTVLLITHARAGTRPDWHGGWAARVGRAAADCGARDRWGRARRVADVVSAEQVQMDRAIYHVWRCGLALVAAELDGALAGFDVVGPSAPESPWEVRGRGPVKGAKLQNSNAG